MKLNDLFCNGKAQARAAAVCTSGNIKPVELFKYPFQLFLRNGICVVCKSNFHVFSLSGCCNVYVGALKTVGNCIFQDIIKGALNFICIAPDRHILRNHEITVQVLLMKHRLKFIQEHFKQARQAYPAVL